MGVVDHEIHRDMNDQSFRVTVPPSPQYFLDGNNNNCLTINDFSLQTALLFSQGDWFLIRRDLEYAGFASKELDQLWCLQNVDEQNYCHEIVKAFDRRKELIHFKKLILHLFHEAEKLEMDFKQYCAFFYWYDGDEVQYGIKVHYDALGESLDLLSYLDSGAVENDDIVDKVISFFTQSLPNSLHLLEDSLMRHKDSSLSNIRLIDRKRLFVAACEQRMFVKGLIYALLDSRDITKAICMSPRHPDSVNCNGALSKRIATQLPQSLLSYQTFLASIKDQETEDESVLVSDISKIHIDDKLDDFYRWGRGRLSNILQRIEDELNWSPHAIDFLKKSIVARGGFKALYMMDHLQMCIATLEPFLAQLRTSLLSNIRSEIFCRNNIKLQDEGPNDSDLSLSIQRHKNIALLSGVILALHETVKWMQVLAGNNAYGIVSATSTRLFVASDEVSSLRACAFVPKEFQLASFFQRPRSIIDCILNPAMHATVSTEEWPPPKDSRRTRALAFRACNISPTSIDLTKLKRCKICCGYFNIRWIHHEYCSICESREKEKMRKELLQTKCFFGQCRVDAFCPHSLRCFVCDAPHTCENLCRFSMGDGELVAEWIEQLKPHYLLIDFDRTLCSTKRGASPIPKHQSSVVHTIDNELKDILINQQLYNQAFIVTRNSHKADIEEFLRTNGLFCLSNNVHVIPKKKSKGLYIKETFYSDRSLSDKVCLYLDDDIRELVSDPFLLEDKRIYRVLFVRGTK